MQNKNSVFEKGVFTYCKDKGSNKKPAWCLQSNKIEHNASKKTIYYFSYIYVNININMNTLSAKTNTLSMKKSILSIKTNTLSIKMIALSKYRLKNK